MKWSRVNHTSGEDQGKSTSQGPTSETVSHTASLNQCSIMVAWETDSCRRQNFTVI